MIEGTNSLPQGLWGYIFSFQEELEPALHLTCELFREILYNPTFIFQNLKELSDCYVTNLSDSQEEQLNQIKRQMLQNLADPKISASNQKFGQLVKSKLSYDGFKYLLRSENFKNAKILFEQLRKMRPDFKALNEELSFKKQEEALTNFFVEQQDFISKVERLDLSYLGLTKCPQELDFFTGLKKLYLNNNLLSKLPVGFGKNWTQLTLCDLSSNNLRELSSFFGENWTQLTLCYLENNKLTEIPPFFGAKWTQLMSCYLDENNLTKLPPFFGENWTQLSVCFLDNNKLTELPSSFGENWTQLTDCDLGCNHLTKLPPFFGKNWTRLIVCNLNRNKLTELPESVGENWNNSNLYLKENPIKKLQGSTNIKFVIT